MWKVGELGSSDPKSFHSAAFHFTSKLCELIAFADIYLSEDQELLVRGLIYPGAGPCVCARPVV